MLTEVAVKFSKPAMGPEDIHVFARRFEDLVRQVARSLEEWCFNSRQPPEVQSMPRQIAYLEQSYRRIRKNTPHANVLSDLATSLTRTVCRQGSRGRTIAERTTAKIGPEKPRNLCKQLASIMAQQRQTCQVEELGQWIDEEGNTAKTSYLQSVVMVFGLGLHPLRIFTHTIQMCCAFTTTVANRKHLCLVRGPEDNQETLSWHLSSLLKFIMRSRHSKLSRFVT